MDGTVTKYILTGPVYPEPYGYYAKDDPRQWRDEHCDDRTWPVEELLQMWKEKYWTMEWIGGSKNEYDAYTQVRWYDEEQKRGYEDCIDLRRIYKEHGWPDNYKGDKCRDAVKQFWAQKRQKDTEEILKMYASGNP